VRESRATWWMKTALLAAVMLAVAGLATRLAGPTNNNRAGARDLTARLPVSASTLSLPLYFEPNQGQTDPQVKFLARGAGYGLFFTANEAVLDLERRSAQGQLSKGQTSKGQTSNDQLSTGAVIRMRLDGASSSARVEGAQPLPGKSNYFIGNNSAKWRANIPQFGRVEYRGVYAGVDLVYYGRDRQLEYDFHVAPGADPSQIVLSFRGASPHIDSGDLVLATGSGDVRFRAPHIYQTSPNHQSAALSGTSLQSDITGSFRLLAANKIGFTVGPYDHSRELVIDPALNYSSYFGGTNGAVVCPSAVPGVPVAPPTEGCPQVVVDSSNYIYLAGSTTSNDFPTTTGAFQPCLGDPGAAANQCVASTAQNVFVAVLNTGLSGTSQLVYATYLGGSGTDSLAGLAIDPTQGFPNAGIYVGGTTSSANFPTVNAFESSATFNPGEVHGFVSKLSPSQTGSAQLLYSTYLAGTNAAGTSSDIVTGIAVDKQEGVYVTGTTTSTDGPGTTPASNGFPSNSYGYQVCPFAPPQTGIGCVVTSGPPQFFASRIDTSGATTGTSTMLYSTYLGGESGTTTIGGGVAVDSNGYMYFTGTTNMPNPSGPGGVSNFIYNAYQSCLNNAVVSGVCQPSTATDGILVKLNPSQSEPNLPPFYSTYLGGSNADQGIAVAVDSSDNAYVTGSTNSTDWNCAVGICNLAPNPPFGYSGTDGSTNAFIAEIANQTQAGAIFPLYYFAWLGGSGANSGAEGDIGQSIVVDSGGIVHLAGQTFSSNLPYNFCFDTGQCSLVNYLQSYQGAGDAFVALVDPSSVVTAGDYVTYLGGTGADQASGIALDSLNNTYVAGTTVSQPSTPCTPPNCTPPITGFPITTTAYQPQLTGSRPDGFITVVGNSSTISVTVQNGSPNPNPVDVGQQATFTFNITNNGPNPASNIYFNVSIPAASVFTVIPTASVSQGSGSCSSLTQTGQTVIPCLITYLAAGSTASVQAIVTPTSPLPTSPYPFSVSCSLSVNGGAFNNCGLTQSDQAVDFVLMPPQPSTLTVAAGGLATFVITASSASTQPPFNGTITFTQSTFPSIVTNGTPTFTPTSVTLDANSTSQTTTLSIQTVARPVSTGSLFRRTSFYAAWLPIGGLSLAGLGIGASSKRRRWIAGALLGLLAALILLQPACSSSSSNVSTNQGTQPGPYKITVTGSSSSNASHQIVLTLNVT